MSHDSRFLHRLCSSPLARRRGDRYSSKDPERTDSNRRASAPFVHHQRGVGGHRGHLPNTTRLSGPGWCMISPPPHCIDQMFIQVYNLFSSHQRTRRCSSVITLRAVFSCSVFCRRAAAISSLLPFSKVGITLFHSASGRRHFNRRRREMKKAAEVIYSSLSCSGVFDSNASRPRARLHLSKPELQKGNREPFLQINLMLY